MKPIGIRLVGTVVRRLVQDCTAAVGENEKQGWRFEIHGAIVERRVGVGGAREQALTFGGQPAGMSRRGGEAESGGERLCRAGHHADPVDVPGRELPPPGRPAEVLVVALVDTEQR